MQRFTYWLISLKYWQVITAGVLAIVVSQAAIAVLAHLGYNSFPDAFGWVAAVHVALALAAGWFVPEPFIDVYVYKKDTDAYRAAWRRILDDVDLGDECCEQADCTAADCPKDATDA